LDQPRTAEPVVSDPWIVVPRPNPRATARLLCFPYAGGGPSVFAHWAGILPEFLELAIVHLPGRGSRLGEPPLARMDALIDALTPSVRSCMAELPCAFLGHSLGALILFEITRHLRRAYRAVPIHLFVSGARAPHYYHKEQLRQDHLQYSPVPGTAGHELADAQLVEMLRDLGFEASRALETNPEMRRLMLPTLRADLRMHDAYRYAPGPPLDVPITAVGGRVDPFVTGEQLHGWRRHTTGSFTTAFRPGGHYFLEREKTFWAELLGATLAPACESEAIAACAG
jgi:surfactin synthase thioesterase subunit